MDDFDVLVIGAGAAGFFSSIKAAGILGKGKVVILEQSGKPLSKLKVSGGGRCNVTHYCFEVEDLVRNYPRGSRELWGPFSRFQPLDMIEWLKERGVELKVEADGRMFPMTDQSQTIIDCFLNEADRLGVKVNYRSKVNHIKKENGNFIVTLHSGDVVSAHSVILAMGGSKVAYELLKSFGHQVVKPLPSLFTFNIPDSPFLPLSGTSVDCVKVTLPEFSLEQTGPLLMTHWGFSGPAVLKLSAFGARNLHSVDYHTHCVVDWLTDFSEGDLKELFLKKMGEKSEKPLSNDPLFSKLSKKLWKVLCELSGVKMGKLWQQLGKSDVQKLIQTLKHRRYQISGKTIFKQEFVTCGGLSLSEVNFKTMESKLLEELYVVGELLDIDGITGGFNFQAAWTTAWIAGESAALSQC